MIRQWCGVGLDAASFWDQSPASYGAAVRGRLDERRHAFELAMYGAWQGERFAREEKLKPWSSYARQAERAAKPRRAQRPVEMLAAFQAIAAGGIGLRFTKIENG